MLILLHNAYYNYYWAMNVINLYVVLLCFPIGLLHNGQSFGR